MKPNSQIAHCVHQPSHYSQIHNKSNLLFALTAIIFILICEASAVADNGAFFVSKWGSQGGVGPYFPSHPPGANLFDGPSGVAIDGAGNIYVADRDNHIRRYDATGQFILDWGGQGSGPGLFNNPRGIALDNLDNVYVVDEGNHRIQKFDSSGNYLQTIGGPVYPPQNPPIQLQYPYAVATWGNFIYVADTYNNRILKIQVAHVTRPEIKKEWTSYGTGNTPFNKPRGIAVDGAGNVYVADSENHHIVKFDSSDAYVNQWGSLGSGDFQLNNPRGMAVDSNGAVYVVDFYNHRIKKYTPNGLFIGKWGGPDAGVGDGQFYFPTFVAVGRGGAIVVSDTSNFRVQKFACDNSNYLASWGRQGTDDGEFNRPMSIAVDNLGNIYVADTNNHRVQKFSSTGTLLFKWGRSGCRPGDGDGEFNHPISVSVDALGNIYVADRDNDRIVRLSSTGGFSWKYPDPNQSYGDQLKHPTYVTSDGTNWWVVAADVDGIKKVFSSRFSDPFGPNDGSILGPLDSWSILLDGGFVYITSPAGDSPSIRKYTLNYDYPYFVKQQPGRFDGLAMDSDHNLYSFNSSTDCIYKFQSDFTGVGTASFIYEHAWGSSGSGNAQFNHPSGVAVDKNCNVYVADAENHRIQKFSTVPSVLLTFPH